MTRLFTSWVGLPLWASPGNSIYDEILRSNSSRTQRHVRTLVPAYTIYDGLEYDGIDEPKPPKTRPIPTDVPVKEPADIPVREPRDVPPPPEPERKVPTPTKEPHDVPPAPKSRPIP